MKPTLVRCAAVLLALGLPVLATMGVTIRDVSIEAVGDQPVDVGHMMTRIRLRPGMAWEEHRGTVNRDVRSLLETGLFADVRVEAQPLSDNDIRIFYVVEPKIILAEPVKISGARDFSVSDYREWTGLRVGDALSEADAAAAAVRVRMELIDRRYRNAEVEAQLRPHPDDPGRGMLSLVVEENERIRLQKIVFKGNTVFSDYQLRRVMHAPRWWNPINWFRRRPYDPESIEMAADLVRDHYRDAGYLDARVGPISSRDAARGRRRAVATVTEGARYTVGNLYIEGAEVLDAEELEDRFTLRPGDVAAMDRIRETAHTISHAYAAKGYRGTRVIPRMVPDPEEAVIDIHFQVREGDLTHIRMIYFHGNWKTRDKVIRRELPIAPGDRFDEVLIRRSENRLRQTGFFSQVHSYAQDWAPGVSDLIFELEEAQTGQLMIGAGFSSVDNIMGFAEISQSNFDLFNWPTFTGAGQKLNLRAQFGETSRDYRLMFIEPWLLDRRLSLGLEGYMRQDSFSEYDVERIGGAVNLAFPLQVGYRMEVGYRFEQNHLTHIADTNRYTGADGQDFFFDQKGRRTKSTVSLAVSRDTRDSVLRPSRGRYMRLGTDYSGGLAGGDTDIYELEARLAAYVPLWWQHVFGVQTRIDIVDTHSGMDDVPLYDRLFAGGQGSVRGFRYRYVGPKAKREVDGVLQRVRPQGGRTRALATAEYTLPVIDTVRLAGFVDAGNVWLDAYEVRTDELAIGAGIGLRLDFPNFPLRFDYAWPLRRDDPATRTQRFSFRIGHGF